MHTESIASWTRSNLSMQGFTQMSDAEKRAKWLAVKAVPGSALIGVVVVLISGSAALSFAFAAVLYVGVATRTHPFDAFFNLISRAAGSSQRMGPTPAPRRFSSGFGAVMFTSLGSALALGASDLVVALIAIPMVIAPSVIVLTNWCLPAFIYRQLERMAHAFNGRTRVEV
jgi:hypothetical protein